MQSQNHFAIRSIAAAVCLGSVLMLFALNTQAVAQEDDEGFKIFTGDPADLPLLERTPFDRIYLDEESDNAELDVIPFKDPLPSNPAPTKLLRFKLLEDDKKTYQVAWKHVVKVRTYAELILDEALAFIDDRTSDPEKTRSNMLNAFERLDKLFSDPRFDRVEGLDDAINKYLYLDAYQLIRNKRYRDAISVADELYRRKKNYRLEQRRPSVKELLAEIFRRLIKAEINSRDYQRAGKFMDEVDLAYKGAFQSTTDGLREEILDIARVFIKNADKLFQQGEPRKAHNAIRQAVMIVPDLKEAQDMRAKIVKRFPMVMVGVSQKFAAPNPRSLHNWAARRSGKLVHRTLVEYAGQGEEGGVYKFPQGRIERSEDFLFLNFVIREKEEKPGLPILDAHSIRRRLLSLADRNSPEYMPAWERLFKKVSVLNDQNLEVELRFSHVLPEAMLQVALERKNFEVATPNGFYAQVPSRDEGDLFKPNPRYEKASREAQMPDIVELFYNDSEELLAALRRGDIDVVDRVFPGQLYILKQDKEIEVQPYAIPTVHMLIPNLRNKHMTDGIFRRALLYAIDRETILNQGLLAGAKQRGFDLITGPFPRGIGESDALSYGYNFSIGKTEYSPFQAMTLLLAADQRLIDMANKEREAEARERSLDRARRYKEGEITEAERLAEQTADEDAEAERVKKITDNPELEKIPRPVLRIAHSTSDIATAACQLIKQQLDIVGVKSELIELPPGKTIPESDKYDLLYAEIMMEEPLIDARRLLAESGLVYAITPMVDRALIDLDGAANWGDVANRLSELHFSCASESIVLPLWQTVEHYAYRKSLSGVGKKITNVYENVQDWKIVPVRK